MTQAAFRPILLISTLTLSTALGACGTIDGLGQDISNNYRNLTSQITRMVNPEKEAKKRLAVYEGECPPVSLRPDLAHLVDFTDETRPTPANITSEITITGLEKTCRIENGQIVLQVDLAMTGKTGPKARANANDQPNFAYPYFLAVTNTQGELLSKEIFAVSVAYGRSENETQLVESVFQNMPVPEQGVSYQVIIGFQLSDAQLAYNHSAGMIASGGTTTTASSATQP